MKKVMKLMQAVKGIKKKVGEKYNRLRMDVLIQFSFLALCLWVIVENSATARTAFATIINAAVTRITAIITSIGTL